MPTRAWNTSYEASPSDSDKVRGGAAAIRQLKTDIRERLSDDHEMADNTADVTGHVHISMVKEYASGAKPTLRTGVKGYLFVKGDVLYFMQEDGTEIDISTPPAAAPTNTQPQMTTLTDASIIQWDAGTNPNALVLLTGNRSLGAPTNTRDGDFYILRVMQDSTGGRTLTFGANYTFDAPLVSSGLASGGNDGTVFAFQRYGNDMQCIGRAAGV